MKMRLLCLLCLCTAFVPRSAEAQSEAAAWMELGSGSTVTDFHYGFGAQARWRLSERVELLGGVRLTNQYPSGLGDLKAGAVVYLQKGTERWSMTNDLVYSNFAPYPLSQLYYRLTFAWQTRYFRAELGNAFAFLMGTGVVKSDLCRPSFLLRGTVRPLENFWNVAFFIRNFNRFEAHGSQCIEWGAELWMRVCDRWRVFCEPYVVTAGNFNGTATYYKFNCLIGGAFLW